MTESQNKIGAGGRDRGSARRSFQILSACLLPVILVSAACRQDMHDNPKFKVNREGANRPIPPGTIERGGLDVNPAAPKVLRPVVGQALVATDTGPVAIGEDGFPFKVTKEILDRGESRFNITCLPCHGKLGDGNGMVVLRGFRRPPTYHQDRLRKSPTSHFYDVVTNGFGAMPSYTDQLTPEDRWKVIAYIRALQLSQNAAVAELAEDDRKKIEEAGKAAPSAGHTTGGVEGRGEAKPAAAPAATAPTGGHSN
ncbi:MAG: c-type cytochrome [Blastocatellia bacterium]